MSYTFITGQHSYYDFGMNGYTYLREHHGIEQYVSRLVKYIEYIADERFIGAVFDRRLIDVLGSMCESVDDAVLFEQTIKTLSCMVDGLGGIHR